MIPHPRHQDSRDSRNPQAPRLCHARAQLAHAEAALARGEAQQALRHAQDAMRHLPDDPRVRLVCARALLQQREYRQACNALDAHDHLCPEDRNEPRVLRLRIDALVGLGLHKLALTVARRLEKIVPYDVEAYRVTAMLSEALGQRNLAITGWRNVLRHAPRYPGARRRLALLLADDHPEEAFELLDGHTDPTTRAALAHRAGRLADAEHAYATLLEETAPPPPEDAPQGAADDAALWLDAGRLACELGELEIAERRLRHAAASRGEQASEALRRLAIVHMRRGDFAAAGYAWWKLARHSENTGQLSAWAWAGLAMCAMITQRPALLRRAERELSVHTSRAERRTLMAELWPDAAAAVTAAAAQTQTPADHPERSPLTMLLRTASHAVGREGRNHPQRADVQYHLAVCNTALGETTLAHQAADRALKINPNYAAASALATKLNRTQHQAA